MAITRVQQGVIGQNEFAKLVMIRTGGLVELAAPLTDDNQRDAELHVRGQFGFALATQIKTTDHLHISEGGSRYLECKFDVPLDRIVNHPSFWYFIAYLDLELMRFADPVFFVPSTLLHTHCARDIKGKLQHYVFKANMEPNGRDLWVPNRVNTYDLGMRVLDVMETLRKEQKLSENLLTMPPADQDFLWLRKAA